METVIPLMAALILLIALDRDAAAAAPPGPNRTQKISLAASPSRRGAPFSRVAIPARRPPQPRHQP